VTFLFGRGRKTQTQTQTQVGRDVKTHTHTQTQPHMQTRTRKHADYCWKQSSNPLWYKVAEVCYLIEEKQLCLVPGSPSSTLLYACNAAARREQWSWWCRNAWHTGTLFDK